MVERSGERSGLWCYANRRPPSLVLWAAGSTGGLGFKGERGGNADGICLPSGRRRRDSVQRQSGWSASISEPRELASLPVRRLTLSDLRVLHYESVGLWSDNVNSPLQMDWYWWTGLKGCSCKWMQRIITNEKKRKKQRRGRGESRFCQLFTSPPFFSAIVSASLRWEQAYHLTADGDLVRSDLKVPPDWFCPHSREWWIGLIASRCLCVPLYHYLPGQTEPLIGT